jgi:hypothetical protein
MSVTEDEGRERKIERGREETETERERRNTAVF